MYHHSQEDNLDNLTLQLNVLISHNYEDTTSGFSSEEKVNQ